MFKIVTDETYKNQKYIHPMFQKDVARIIKCAKETHSIHNIIIFGSSVSLRCNPSSDIDVFLETDIPIEKRIFREKLCDLNIDLWTTFDVDERLYKEIIDTGVEVY